MRKGALNSESLTVIGVASVWLGLLFMVWGIVCAFRLSICGAVLALVGATLYIVTIRGVRLLGEKTYSGLPRKDIEWYPTIDYKLCTGCGVCADFCHEHVYEKQGDKVVVARPYDCLVSCESCRPRCPVGAIKFPSRQELKQMLRALREKYGYGQVNQVKTQ